MLSPLAAQAEALARRSAELAQEVGRSDLLDELARVGQGPPAAAVSVVVCGERDSGKRALVNALLDRAGLLPTGDDATTAVHVLIRAAAEGEPERLLLHRFHGDPLERPVEELAELATEAAVSERGVRYLELAVDHPLLRAGIVLVDTPGLGGLARARGQVVLSSLNGADAALVVIDGGAPISPLELGFLSDAIERVDDLVVALDRNDRQHGWREVGRETEEHLARLAALRGRAMLLPVSARMKLRADRLAGSAAGDGIAGDLVRESGIRELAERLARLAAERSGALRAAKLCRLAGGVVERLAAHEQEVCRSADKSTGELRERLGARNESRERLARELPGLRRRLNNELRVVQKEADAASVARLNSLRRAFDKRLAEGEHADIASDLEAELLTSLEESLADVRARLEATASEMATALGAYGARMGLERAALEPAAAPALAAVELPPSAGGGEWLARAPFAAGALLLNPLYAVVAVAGLLFDRHRVRRRAEREQLSRQIAETVNEARAQLSVAVHHALVNGQSAITEAFEDAAAQRRDELDEEAAAIKAQLSLSEAERARAAAEAQARVARLSDLRSRIEETRRGALGALAGRAARVAGEASP